MIKKSIVGLCVSLLFTGCASTGQSGSDPTVAENSKPERICTSVKKTGSNIRTTRCVTKEQAEREKDAAQTAMRKLQRTAPKNID